MNITEIETYRKAPSPASFLAIDDAKEKEIDRQIQKLKNIKTVMQEKKEKNLFFVKLYKIRKSGLKYAKQKNYYFIHIIFQKMIYQKPFIT